MRYFYEVFILKHLLISFGKDLYKLTAENKKSYLIFYFNVTLYLNDYLDGFPMLPHVAHTCMSNTFITISLEKNLVCLKQKLKKIYIKKVETSNLVTVYVQIGTHTSHSY